MHGQLNRRSRLVYTALATVWLAVVLWQGQEHLKVRALNRAAMINRGRDITSTLGVVLRSQRHWGFSVKERLEPALRDLIRPGYLDSIALLSTNGEQVVSAGAPIDLSRELILGPGVYWGQDSLTLMNLVDLGTSEGPESSANRTTIVVPREMLPNPFSSNRMSFRHRGDRRGRGGQDGPHPGEAETQNSRERPGGPADDAMDRPPPPLHERRGRPPFGRPPWVSEAEYQALIQKRGIHSFVIGMPTDSMLASNVQDLWMRVVILLLATAAAGVSAFAWRNVARSAELQIRLVRASEMNAHLKEMNLAAAGLAHETRNPLNLIRGLAQMISKEGTAQPDVRDRSKAIMDEADRVTAQLNEFINYSRPREVRRGAISFYKVAREVARALSPDAEDKQIEIRVPESNLQIDADDQLFRQVLFNLILNAVQAVGEGGVIDVEIRRVEGADEAVIEVRDNGPGVPPEQRSEIFKPYVTMHQNGTGLGLAIVHQIVSAHGWEIDCNANDPHGAVFSVRRIKLASGKKP